MKKADNVKPDQLAKLAKRAVENAQGRRARALSESELEATQGGASALLVQDRFYLQGAKAPEAVVLSHSLAKGKLVNF